MLINPLRKRVAASGWRGGGQALVKNTLIVKLLNIESLIPNKRSSVNRFQNYRLRRDLGDFPAHVGLTDAVGSRVSLAVVIRGRVG